MLVRNKFKARLSPFCILNGLGRFGLIARVSFSVVVIMAAVMDTGLASSPSMTCEPDWMGLKFNLFAFDFDGTCTQKDTTSLLYKASEKYRSSTQAEMKTIDERWIEIGTIYWQGHQETVSKSMALHTDPNSLPHFNEKGLRSFLQEVSKYDMAMIKKVEASEILKGISKEGIKEIAKEVKFSPGCLNVLNHINLPLHLISVNWCQELIQTNLDHLRHLNIFANSFPLEGELSSGHVGKKVTGPFDKETIFQDLVHKLSTNSSNGISVFVGDSIGDILAMLKADVGIVVGKSHTLRKVAKAFGIKFLPLQEIQKMARNECQEFATPKERGVLFEAPSWNEIGFTLFGTRYIPNKF